MTAQGDVEKPPTYPEQRTLFWPTIVPFVDKLYRDASNLKLTNAFFTNNPVDG